MSDDPYRHQCERAKTLYFAGSAVLFYATDWAAWVLATPTQEAFEAWAVSHGEPHLLACRQPVGYGAQAVGVRWCPWCGHQLPRAGATVTAAVAAGAKGVTRRVD